MTREFHALREAWAFATYAVDRLPTHPRLRSDLTRLHFAVEDLDAFFVRTSRGPSWQGRRAAPAAERTRHPAATRPRARWIEWSDGR